MTEHQSFPGAGSPTSRTGIIRRVPTAAMPVAAGQPSTVNSPPTTQRPGAAVPITACTLAIVSGWATSVVATDLIASWWRTDRLFCVAVAFLTLVFAATTIGGVILLLRQHSLGRYLVAIGAVVALLTFGSLFIAGARVPWIVHAVPAVQLASALLALHPITKRWLLSS